MSDEPKVHFTRKRRRDEELELEVNVRLNAELETKIIDNKREEQLELNLMHQNVEFGTKITDINNDCLERIFMYLDFEDFIDIAHTNKQLKPAADMAFARKFAKKTINLEYKSKYRGKLGPKIRENMIRLYDFQTSLRLLRCFGHLISQLEVGTPNSLILKWTDINIVGYINEYCSESLDQIKFRNMSTGAFDDLKKSFAVVTSVTFDYCTLDGKLANFSEWFPAIRSLTLNCFDTQLDHIEINSPHLHNLEVFGHRQNSPADRIMKVLRLNSPLQHLRLDVDGWIEFLQDASQNLVWLNSIYIRCFAEDFLEVKDHIFNFRHLNEVKMNFRGHGWGGHGLGRSALPIPISFEGLQNLTWHYTCGRSVHFGPTVTLSRNIDSDGSEIEL